MNLNDYNYLSSTLPLSVSLPRELSPEDSSECFASPAKSRGTYVVFTVYKTDFKQVRVTPAISCLILLYYISTSPVKLFIMNIFYHVPYVLSVCCPSALFQMMLQAGHYDPEAIRNCAEKVAIHWQQLMLKMEDRLKLVNASVAFYKTSEQVRMIHTYTHIFMFSYT